jgi:hypothetical protein
VCKVRKWSESSCHSWSCCRGVFSFILGSSGVQV